MTYARSRLWLGITGVGTAVVIATALLVTSEPTALLPTSTLWSMADVWTLVAVVLAVVLLQLPLDILGGYVLPKRFGRTNMKIGSFFVRWISAVVTQSMLFVCTALAMLAVGRVGGVPGVLALVLLTALAYLVFQRHIALLVAGIRCFRPEDNSHWRDQLGERTTRLMVAEHSDPGFTGGIVGLPGRERIIVPRLWIEGFTKQQLQFLIARREAAIQSGSHSRGVGVAMAWILVGFLISTWLPRAGVESVAQLVTTFCGFTCWTFVGLLLLPTLSRKASYNIDQLLRDRGVPDELVEQTLLAVDSLQDAEPQRPSVIEAIFHPVPSVNNRMTRDARGDGAWHAARITLFLSWSCAAWLSRAVHCNAGRPELWVMLPTD